MDLAYLQMGRLLPAPRVHRPERMDTVPCMEILGAQGLLVCMVILGIHYPHHPRRAVGMVRRTLRRWLALVADNRPHRERMVLMIDPRPPEDCSRIANAIITAALICVFGVIAIILILIGAFRYL